MRKPLNIACIGTRGLPSTYSGIEIACESLYSRLAARGHNVTVYCRSDSIPSSLSAYRGIQLRRVPAIRCKSFETLSHVFASIVHAIQCETYDIIHCHALAPGLLSTMWRSFEKPIIFTVHGLDWQRTKWKGIGAQTLLAAERSMVRNADRILVVSRDLQQYYSDRYHRDTVYVPNGVETLDEAIWKESSVLQAYALRPREYILFLGRLVPEKRVEDLIVAYRRVRCPYRLVIAGESSYTDKYVARLRQLGMSDSRVVFIGAQARPAVHALLHNAALFVSPSALEGLPMSLLECLQHATFPVVSDIAPHREVLGKTKGYDSFFPPGSVDLLQARIETALAAGDEIRRVAEDARQVVSKTHSWAVAADTTESEFYGALGEGNLNRVGMEFGSVSTRVRVSELRRGSVQPENKEHSKACAELQG